MEDKSKQIVANSASSLCPCGSGLPIIKCCIAKVEDTVPKGPATGYSNPNCYARSLGDCSRKISKEHFMSACLLKLIAENNTALSIQGPAWLKHGEEKQIAISSLAPKILCERHNNVLSGLDNLACEFWDYIFSLKAKPEALMVNGAELERWMLKVLCGHLASGWTGAINSEIPLDWLNILFGKKQIPNGSGLYVLRGVDISTARRQVGGFLVESDTPGVANGLHFILGGFQFLLFMGKPGRQLPQRLFSLGWQMRYRPECLVVIVDSVQREVHFGPPPWGSYVVIKVDK